MKTPEDEAWEEMERRQSGGFPAKRAMAADKLGWPPSSVITPEYLAEQENKNKKTRAALPAQEPVAHRDGFWCKDLTCKKCYSADFRFKHTTSPQRTWVGLTDEAVLNLADYYLCDGGKTYGFLEFARAIEAKLKEKNT